nr:hypothetical protein [uncultured Flavobacterium sp.]
MEREQFINEVLNSVDAIQKVSPSGDLYFKIEQRINNQTVPARVIWMVAASIVVLLTINIIAFGSKAKTDSDLEITLATTLNKSNQLY